MSSTTLPWLYFNGVEVANGARVLDYLSRGLAGSPHIEPGLTQLCSALYLPPPGTTGPSRTFVSPAADPAPWYDAATPESAGFLGAYIDTIRGLDTPTSRKIDARMGGLGGGTLGPQRLDARTLSCRAYLFANGPAALEYGTRWLAGILSIDDCAPCLTADAQIRTACPPSGRPETVGRWTLHECGLTAGPSITDYDSPDLCGLVREVSFDLTAQNPFLYADALNCLSTGTLNPGGGTTDFCTWFTAPGASIACQMPTTPAGGGVRGAVITIQTGSSALLNVTVSAYQSACPPPGGATPLVTYTIATIPAQTRLVIDSSRHRILQYNPDGSLSDGTQLITLPAGTALPWFEGNLCTPATCLVVGIPGACGGAADVSVTIDTVLRQR